MRRTAREQSFSTAVGAVVILHFAYLLYVPSGGFLALRSPRTLVLHIAAVAWGVAVIGLKLPCPLTSLESWARRHAKMDPLPTTGFIDRYVEGFFVPSGRIGVAQGLAFVTAAVSWAAFVARTFRRRAVAAQ